MPKPGRIRMYTSGWPKNQNRCWNSTGSPPPSAEKKVVPKLRSVKSMVIAPASTGSDSNNRNTVTRIDHTNSGILCKVMPGARMLKMVVMKLMAPRIDEAPARWIDRMAKSTAGPGWPEVDSGAYSVQPVPTPLAPGSPSTKVEIKSSAKDAGSSQNEMLFIRGNAMSGAPIISGTIQLPKPPIIAGITMKKIMIRPCEVTNTSYVWVSWKIWMPGNISSARIAIDIAAPMMPATIANTRYIVPMSLWFVE